jgi:hypothetical protein
MIFFSNVFYLFFFKIQEKDYDNVIKCLSPHIPKIYDENSINNENKCIKTNIFSDSNKGKCSYI